MNEKLIQDIFHLNSNLEKKIKNKSLQNSANVSICEYLVKDINMYIEAYEYKNDNEQKKQYILNFLKKKSPTIYKIIREDFELGLKTISQIKSPKVQFELIQCNKSIKQVCQKNLSNISNKEFIT